MKTFIIVQARMTSTRLPGKVLMEVLGKPLLEYLVERLRRVTLADEIVIATTTNHTDLPIVACCERLGVAFTRGSESDVLARYHAAALLHQADLVVRVTSDCPLIDPLVIDEAIALHRAGELDYVSNALQPGYPCGMAVEVLSFRLLDESFREAVAEAEREHVTPFVYLRPQRYRIGHLASPVDLSQYRWTVDTAEDFALVKKMLEAVYPGKPDFNMADLLDLHAEHPAWRLINASVQQKTLAQ